MHHDTTTSPDFHLFAMPSAPRPSIEGSTAFPARPGSILPDTQPPQSASSHGGTDSAQSHVESSPVSARSISKDTSWGTLSTFSGFSKASPSTARSSLFSDAPVPAPNHRTQRSVSGGATQHANRQSMSIERQPTNTTDNSASDGHGQTSQLSSHHVVYLPTDRSWLQYAHGHKVMPPMLANVVPYYVGYDHASTDYDCLLRAACESLYKGGTLTHGPLSSLEKQSALSLSTHPRFVPPHVPQTVLDVGCGLSANWIVQMAQIWPDTQFTGLDIGPCLLPPEYVPESMRHRLQFRQTNFLEPFPFEDQVFDFVRVAHVEAGVPEHKWSQLFDEAARVCKKTGHVQVFAVNLAFNRQLATDRTQPDALTDTAIENVYDYVVQSPLNTMDRRLVSPFPLSHIKASLILSLKNIEDSGLLSLPLPVGPLASQDTHAGTGTGTGVAQKIGLDNLRVLNQAHLADWTTQADLYFEDFCRLYDLEDISYKDTTDLTEHFQQGPKGTVIVGNPSKSKQQPAVKSNKDASSVESKIAFDRYKREKLQCIGITELLAKKLDWVCPFDVKAERSFEHNLATLTQKLQQANERGLDQMPANSEAGHMLYELEKRIRETEAELDAIGARLRPTSIWTRANDVFKMRMSATLEIQSFTGTPL